MYEIERIISEEQHWDDAVQVHAREILANSIKRLKERIKMSLLCCILDISDKSPGRPVFANDIEKVVAGELLRICATELENGYLDKDWVEIENENDFETCFMEVIHELCEMVPSASWIIKESRNMVFSTGW